MLSSVVTRSSPSSATPADQPGHLATNLPTVGISLLVLLGLSCHLARDYATRTATFPSASLGVASPAVIADRT